MFYSDKFIYKSLGKNEKLYQLDFAVYNRWLPMKTDVMKAHKGMTGLYSIKSSWLVTEEEHGRIHTFKHISCFLLPETL